MTNYKRLVAAVLLQAAKDRAHPEYQNEVVEFARSPWFETLAELVEVDPARTRGKLLAGQVEASNIRAAYR
jgi:hypothetical protein